MQKLFPEALWVDACKPGYILALDCKHAMDRYKAASGKDCNLLFQNLSDATWKLIRHETQPE